MKKLKKCELHVFFLGIFPTLSALADLPEREGKAEFFTIYGTFNSARELMWLYLVDGWYIMEDNSMLLASFHTFLQNYNHTFMYFFRITFIFHVRSIEAGGHFFEQTQSSS